MKIIIGIDPGITGAIAALREHDHSLVSMTDMPVMPDGKGKKSKVDSARVSCWLENINAQGEVAMVYLERVAARPGQGVSSMFSFGRSLGAVEGVISAMGLPLTYVTPQSWKRRAGLVGAEKDASRGRVIELYSNADVHRKRDSGRADAVLIARFGRG